jgi:hypothetical protein
MVCVIQCKYDYFHMKQKKMINILNFWKERPDILKDAILQCRDDMGEHLEHRLYWEWDAFKTSHVIF